MATSVQTSESILQFSDMFGAPNVGRSGLGARKAEKRAPKGTKLYRTQVKVANKSLDDEADVAKAVSYTVQCNWTRWVNYVKNDLTWTKVLNMNPTLLKFCLQSTYDTLPTPANLYRWRISPETSCPLPNCDKYCTTAHVLSGCKVALRQHRFTWRHDSILADLHAELADFLAEAKETCGRASRNHIKFIRPGTTPSFTKPRGGSLHTAPDWKLLVDLGNGLIFPPHIASSAERPDIVLYSDLLKRTILVELTSPCEENFTNRNTQKRCKYHARLVPAIRRNGWAASVYAVEVGARGYCASSLKSCLFALGMKHKRVKRICDRLSLTSLKCSFHIWMARNTPEWKLDTANAPRVAVEAVKTTHPQSKCPSDKGCKGNKAPSKGKKSRNLEGISTGIST